MSGSSVLDHELHEYVAIRKWLEGKRLRPLGRVWRRKSLLRLREQRKKKIPFRESPPYAVLIAVGVVFSSLLVICGSIHLTCTFVNYGEVIVAQERHSGEWHRESEPGIYFTLFLNHVEKYSNR